MCSFFLLIFRASKLLQIKIFEESFSTFYLQIIESNDTDVSSLHIYPCPFSTTFDTLTGSSQSEAMRLGLDLTTNP